MKDLYKQLHDYVSVMPTSCRHPIRAVDDNYFCHDCNTQLVKHGSPSKDETIAAQVKRIEELEHGLKEILLLAPEREQNAYKMQSIAHFTLVTK